MSKALAKKTEKKTEEKEELSAENKAALAFVSGKLSVVFHDDVDELSDEEVIAAFALVNKVNNAVARRMRELRKRVDVLLAAKQEEPRKEGDEPKGFIELDYLGLKVIQTNKNFGGKILSEEKVLELLAEKGVDKAHVFTMPEAPVAYFNPEKVKALVTLGMLKQEEFDGCTLDAEPSYVVSVDVAKPIDASITAVVLGPHKEPAKK